VSKYRRIATDEIVVDGRYQRPVEDFRVQKIAESFDETLFGVLEVSRRNGVCAVFDGQHRLEAAKRLGMSVVPCLVHEGLDPEAEAKLFVRLQRERKNINPNDRFKARLFYRDPVALALQQLANDAGFEIKTNAADAGPDAWRIRAVSALERVYNAYGPEHVTATLVAIKDWWGGDRKSTDGALLEGVAYFLKAYDGGIRDDHVARLRETPPVTILRRAVGMGGGGQQMGIQVADELKRTAGMRGPLAKVRKARQPKGEAA
jgi:hypothetical protein